MRVGLDIGSTTIKCAVLDDSGKLIWSTYERHYSHILEKGKELLQKISAEYLPEGKAILAISGSVGMGLAESSGVPFVQEVYAERVAANRCQDSVSDKWNRSQNERILCRRYRCFYRSDGNFAENVCR